MKELTKFFAIAILLFAFSVSKANASGEPSWTTKYEHSKSFIENKGQFNLPYKTNEHVEFAYDNSSTRIYFTKKGLTYSFLKVWKDQEEEGESLHGVRVRPEGHALLAFGGVGVGVGAPSEQLKKI